MYILPIPEDMRLGQLIRKKRLLLPRSHKCSSQAGLAVAVGCNRHHILEIEKGCAVPSPKLEERLRRKLNITKEEFPS